MPFGVIGGDQVTLTWYALTSAIDTLVGGEPGTAKEKVISYYIHVAIV